MTIEESFDTHRRSLGEVEGRTDLEYTAVSHCGLHRFLPGRMVDLKAEVKSSSGTHASNTWLALILDCASRLGFYKQAPVCG